MIKGLADECRMPFVIGGITTVEQAKKNKFRNRRKRYHPHKNNTTMQEIGSIIGIRVLL